jgi:hypothetical protein
MKRAVLQVIFALMLGYGWGSARADSTYDMAPLYRNVNAANPGLEQVVPYGVKAGTWSGDVPLTATVSFRVFPAGKTNLLYASAPRVFTPPRPCTNPVSAWVEGEPKWVALPGSAWTYQAWEFDVHCREQPGGDEIIQSAVYIYSANLAAAGGAVWTKTFNNRWLDAFQSIDTNGDGTVDALMLVMPYENSSGGDNEQVVILNPTNGAVISSAGYVSEVLVP